MTDEAAELAIRVVDRWFPGEDAYHYAEERDDLIRIIVEELRVGGWQKRGVPEGVDMAGATFS